LLLPACSSTPFQNSHHTQENFGENPALRSALQLAKVPLHIFTVSASFHAERCLK